MQQARQGERDFRHALRTRLHGRQRLDSASSNAFVKRCSSCLNSSNMYDIDSHVFIVCTAATAYDSDSYHRRGTEVHMYTPTHLSSARSFITCLNSTGENWTSESKNRSMVKSKLWSPPLDHRDRIVGLHTRFQRHSSKKDKIRSRAGGMQYT